jgi:Fic family protein
MEPFVPDRLPISNLDFSQLISFVGESNAALARYDGMLQSVVNPAILLSPLTTQEAVLSSRIEGTQATLDEVLEHAAGQTFEENKTQDIQEVFNYRQALTQASKALQDQPLSLGMVKQMHSMLLDSVRGQNKEPGQFRKDQNWIGPEGCTIEEATFVPPSPLQLLDHLEAWQGYLNGDDVDLLIQAAVVHAQFELLHPFMDGNGRIGRLLVPLFLFHKGVLSQPMFYLSGYLEQNRDEYYARLQGISQYGQWNEWIVFFLKAVSTQAVDNTKRVQSTLALYEEMKGKIQSITHSQFTIQLLDALFDRPIFQTSDAVQRTGLAKQTLMPLLRQLKDADLLTPLREASGRRPAILAFPALLNIAEGREVL